MNDETSIETISQQISNAIGKAFEKSCPLITKKHRKRVPWWNNELFQLRQIGRKAFRRARITKNDIDINIYKIANQNYKKELRKARKSEWIARCEEVQGMKPMALMNKI